MCHYAQLTVPVPPVIVVVLNPPEGELVEPVNPAPVEEKVKKPRKKKAVTNEKETKGGD